MARLLALASNFIGLAARLLVVLTVLCANQVNAQGTALEQQLLGTWRATNLLITFRADGRFEARIAGKKTPVAGRWQVVNRKHLLTWSDDSRPKRINEFSIRGDYLMIMQSAKRVVVHQRVDSTSARAR